MQDDASKDLMHMDSECTNGDGQSTEDGPRRRSVRIAEHMDGECAAADTQITEDFSWGSEGCIVGECASEDENVLGMINNANIQIKVDGERCLYDLFASYGRDFDSIPFRFRNFEED